MDIIISHVFRMDLTKQCLDSIPDCHSVQLIDNSITGECRGYADRRSFVKWLRPDKPPLSYAASLNKGIRACDGKWVVLSNNDILFGPTFTKQAEDLVKKGEEKGFDLVVGPLSSPWACVLLSRNAFKKVGEFDTRFKPCAGEDDDFWIRFCKAGLKWVIVPFSVWHLEGGHHSRIDQGRNIKVFENKWGFKYGSDEHNEIIQTGQWKPKIVVPK